MDLIAAARRGPLRFTAGLASWLALGTSVILMLPTSALIDPLRVAYARAAAASLQLLRLPVQVSDTLLRGPQISIEVVSGCTGLIPGLLFTAGVLAFPCSARRKVLGLVWGLPLLAFINLLRLMSLYVMGLAFPQAVPDVHVWAWQGLVIFSTLIVWLVWARKAVS